MTTKDNRTPNECAKTIECLASGQNSQPTTGASKSNDTTSAAPNHPGDQFASATQEECVAGDQTTSTDQVIDEPQTVLVSAGSNLPPTNVEPKPTIAASAAPNFPTGQDSGDTQEAAASADQTPGRHGENGDHARFASGPDFTNTQARNDAHRRPGVGEPTSRDGHRSSDAQTTDVVPGPILASPLLATAADIVSDIEDMRVANENRVRTLTGTDEYGFSLTPDHPDVAKIVGTLARINCKSPVLASLGYVRPPKKRGEPCCLEHQAITDLEAVMRAHPLGSLVAASPGLGAKQAARLLGAIRDPYWNDLHDRPRTVSELWAYCGLHVLHPAGHSAADTHAACVGGVAPKRQRGQKANWNEDARKRVWLIAASCVKQPAERSHYRRVYDATRAKYAEAVHNSECVRCGPKGKPAQPGSPLSLGHQHARGLRAVAKEVLRDLWAEAKQLHTESIEEQAA